MHLVHPYLLWLWLLLPLLAIWSLWNRRRAALRFPGAQTFMRLPAGRSRLAEYTGLGLRLALLALLIMGLARPRWPDERTRIPAQSTAIQMVLDVSGSMNEHDFIQEGRPVTRLDAAKQAFRWFLAGDHRKLRGRFDDLVGLMTFAARSEQVSPPTLSHSVVLKLLDEAEPLGTPPESTTNIGDAIIEGIGLLESALPQQKFMVLLTDGEHNVPAEVVKDARKPRQAAQIARALGIRIYTIYVGPSAVGSNPPADQGAKEAEASLRDVAAMTGGRFFAAQDIESLLEVCREIDQQERTPVQSFQYYRYHEAYPWVGLACIVLLLGVVWLEGDRWLRLP